MDLREILEKIEPVDETWIEKARARTAQLVMPTRALGRLHDIGEQICGIRKNLSPSIEKKAILIMAGDHGVVKAGVSAYPQEVTGAMLQAFLSGGAGINAISRHVDVDVWVVDMGIIPDLDSESIPGGERLIVQKLDKGTANFLEGPAMSRDEGERSIVAGFEQASRLFDQGIEMLGTGDMGIGNTTPSAAIGSVITGIDVSEMVGRGTGVDGDGLNRKMDVVSRGIQMNEPEKSDGIDVLSKVGGYEIGGIAGCILAGAYYRRPVVIDGYISTAGALVAHALCPLVADYMIAGHCSQESGHKYMLEHLKLKPVLDLGMRLGEGSGGALAMGVIDCAVKVFQEVATFEEASVPGRS